MENKLSINNINFDNINLDTIKDKTINISSQKIEESEDMLSDDREERYSVLLLKKLSKPLPKIKTKIKLTKHSKNYKTINNFKTISNNKMKSTNKLKFHAETTSPKLKNSIKNSKSTKTLKIQNAIKLDKLYGYDKIFYESKTNLRKNKNEKSLQKYQENIVKIAGRTLSKDHLFKLITDLKGLRYNAEIIKPLPSMNFKSLIIHSIHENEIKKRDDGKSISEMDDFEKEMYFIKKSKAFRRNKTIKNKRLYKIYEILPEHVVETLSKNKMLKI